MKPVLLDTGVIVAWMDASELRHTASVEAMQRAEGPLLTCEAVIAESCHLLRGLPGAAQDVMANVTAGIFQISCQLSSESDAVKSILRKYYDQRIDLADACLIRMAEQFETGDILTLDKEFAVYRWGRNRPFHILL